LYNLNKEIRYVQPGSRLGPYEIVAAIGAGGMGEVYRARDTRLGRDVAIKVLPAQFASDPERLRRFEQEARAVAALSHPNILALYDVGVIEPNLGEGLAPSRAGASPAPTSTQGTRVPYIVTELLEGESLRERLRTAGLTVRKAVEAAIQIAQGLAVAHEKGIVHRDLKPANVFVTKDGHVKILDFGIAMLTRPGPGPEATPSTPEPSTEAGAPIGTVGYMSPEQVRGLPADHRTDIFSFGCVLYELLSGRPPFRRDTPAETMTAILHEDAPALEGIWGRVPVALSGIVDRCLEKRPENRFSSAHDLALGLQAESGALLTFPHGHRAVRRRRAGVLALAGCAVLAAASVLIVKLKPAGPGAQNPGPPKIVVLPFENLGLKEDAYFAAGMTEEITSRLANVRGLGVISHTSAAEYNRQGKTVKRIGSDLGVDYVLEGSVRWERSQGHESRVRITPQLIRVADDTHVWTDRYDRVIADVFAMQSEVAECAVKAMGVTLLPHEQTTLREISTNNLEAYDLYLRGQELYNGGNDRRHLEGALQMYQAAVDRDSRFAQAHAGLARSRLMMFAMYYDRSQEQLVRGKEAAGRAVELRPDLAETHNALGYYHYWGLLDYPRALSEFSAALKIQPNSSDTLFGIGCVLRRQGHWAEAVDAMRKALELDPKNSLFLENFAGTCVLARRYADADRAFELAIALSPTWGDCYGDKGWHQVRWHGDVEKGQAVLDEARRFAGLRDDTGVLALSRLGVSLARRDFRGALTQLESEENHSIDNTVQYLPIPLLRGEVQMLARQQDLARQSFEVARLELEQKLVRDPGDARFHSSLGIAYAGLGRSVDAVREAKLGCDGMPVSKDTWPGIYRLEDLARVYTMAGRTSDAIAQLDDLLARSGEFTPNVLRLDPRWDPLRSDPKFRALLTKYEVKP
jgi:eukaryotic-like serine/threonine-protein kinase